MAAATRRWFWLSLLLLAVVLPRAGQTQTLDASQSETGEAIARVQVLEGRISTGALQPYRVTGLKQGQILYVHAKTTSGNLDPLVALLKPERQPRRARKGAAGEVDQDLIPRA